MTRAVSQLFLTANDPQTTNDPRPQMIPLKVGLEWILEILGMDGDKREYSLLIVIDSR